MLPRAGCIYYVTDERVAMPPEQYRTKHDRRTVLVISAPTHNDDEAWPIVLVCPVSSGELSSIHDVRVGAGVGGLRKKGWVRVALTQPVEKNDLQDCLSLNPIPPALLTQVHANLVNYLGVT